MIKKISAHIKIESLLGLEAQIDIFNHFNVIKSEKNLICGNGGSAADAQHLLLNLL